jgi:hypothetical protein
MLLLKPLLTQNTMNAKIEKPNASSIPGKTGENPISEELEYLWDERDASGNSYDIYLGKISRSPVVRSKSSGKYFILPWSEVIKRAIRARIDQ